MRKDRMIHFRLDAETLAVVEHARKNSGQSLSDWLRDAVRNSLVARENGKVTLPHPPDGQAVPVIYTEKQEGK